MPHASGLITALAVGFGLALIFGFIAARLRLPALVGYLVAGVIIGPATPGFVADPQIAEQLADVGVMLLMFGVGLRFSIDDLLAVRRIAAPGAVVGMVVATSLGAALATTWGWKLPGALVFGLSLSVASTVVLLKALESQGVADSANGRIAIGWLVVEDLVMVLVLVLLPALSSPTAEAPGGAPARNAALTVVTTVAQVGGFIAIMLIVGRRFFPWLLWQVTKTGSRELFTLCVVAAAVGIAFGSAELFGVSFTLGAFFAGLVMRESEFSQRAAEQTLPLQDAFAVLFFVSVGMLFDPEIVVAQPLRLLATVAVIVLGKPIAAMALVLAFNYPVRTALTVSASLAQIGEFSFILAGLGMTLGLLPKDGQSLILAGAVASIAVNPVLFAALAPVEKWLLRKPGFASRHQVAENPLAELPVTTEDKYLAKQIVLVGWGRVGKRIAAGLAAERVPFVIAEENREFVKTLRNGGVPAVWGDATDPAVLIQAHIKDARALVIATPETMHVRKMVEIARALNPKIQIVVRSHNAHEAALLESEGAGTVFIGEIELADSMLRHLLELVEPQSRP